MHDIIPLLQLYFQIHTPQKEPRQTSPRDELLLPLLEQGKVECPARVAGDVLEVALVELGEDDDGFGRGGDGDGD